MLSPLFYTLYTNDCIPSHPSNTIIKFADDTTVVGLISGGDETAYREEVQRLSTRCAENNLILNTSKTKELIIDRRRNKPDIQSIYMNRESVERVSDFRFLGIHIQQHLTWTINTKALMKKAQQRLYFLRILRKDPHNLQE